MRFGRDDERKILQRSCHTDFRIESKKAASLDLTEIIDLAIRTDRPKHICRVSRTELKRSWHLFDGEIDLRAASSRTFNPGRAFHARKSCCSPKLNIDQLI